MIDKLAKLLSVVAIVLAVPTVAVVANANHHHQGRRIADASMGKHMENLNLTPEQKTKMEQLHQSTRAQMEQVLTPEQRQKFQQIKDRSPGRMAGENGMNLTADQKAKMKAIHQANREQLKTILTPAQQAQLKQGGGGWGKGGPMARLDKLNLTSDQKAKMEQLQASTRTQMEAILTPEQQQKAKAMQDRRQMMGDTWKSLNLTADQKAKMTAIRKDGKKQLNAILTPEQQAKLKSRKHGKGHNPM